jgi:hypothetical protein
MGQVSQYLTVLHFSFCIHLIEFIHHFGLRCFRDPRIFYWQYVYRSKTLLLDLVYQVRRDSAQFVTPALHGGVVCLPIKAPWIAFIESLLANRPVTLNSRKGPRITFLEKCDTNFSIWSVGLRTRKIGFS